MTSVKVQFPLPQAVSIGALRELLVVAGMTPLSDADWSLDCPEGDGSPVLLMVMPNQAASHEEIELAVRTFVSQGGRVVVVWFGDEPPALPPSIEDYGAALVVWDASALRASICGDPEWQDAGGDARPGADFKRNRC